MAGISEESLQQFEQEHVFQNIFRECDVDGTGKVKVSILIEFIAPFIELNSRHLHYLKHELDPLDKNPEINYDLFCTAMKSWTETCNKSQTNVSSNETSECSKSLAYPEFQQSTPIKGNSEKLVTKNDFNFGNLDLSNTSSYSYSESVQSACDPAVFYEQINELKYQNKKLTDLLNEVRGQLTSSEELNNSLQNNNDKLNKIHQTDQKMIEDLQKVRSELEKEREENAILTKNHNSVKQNLSSCKKENSQLRKQISEFENEIQKYQEIHANLQKCHEEIKKRDSEIFILQDKLTFLNDLCSENDDIIRKISEENENFKHENNVLNTQLNDFIKNNATKSEIDYKSGITFPTTSFFMENVKKFNSSTPKTRKSSQFSYKDFYNSPKTLQMINNPISPILNSPTLFFSSRSTSVNVNVTEKSRVNSKQNLSLQFIPKSEPNILLNSSLESTSSNKSLNPEIFNDSLIPDKSTEKPDLSPQQDSLQLELLKALPNDCFGAQIFCEHKSKLNQYVEDNKLLIDTNEKYMEEINNLKQSICDINNQNTNLQIQNQNTSEKLQELIKNNELYQIEIKDLNLLINDLKSQILSSKIERKRYLRQQQKVQKLEKELFEVKTHVEIAVNENTDLKVKYSELQMCLKQTQEKLQEAKEEKEKLKAEIIKLKSNLEDTKQQLQKTENRSKDLIFENENLQLKIDQVFQDLRNSDQNNNNLQDRLIKISNERDEMNNQNKLHLSKNKKLSSHIESLENKLQNFRKLFIDLKTEKSVLEDNVQKIADQRDLLISHVHYAKQEIRLNVNHLEKNTQKITDLWHKELEVIIKKSPNLELLDEKRLSGIMKKHDGILLEEIQMLISQVYFTTILLKSLVKLKENKIFNNNASQICVDLNSNASVDMNEEQIYPSIEYEKDCVDTDSKAISEVTNLNQCTEILDNNQNEANGQAAHFQVINKTQRKPLKKYRSMSEGTAIVPHLTEDDDVMLSPHLQDHILESLGLYNEDPARERLSEEEIEAKFQTLILIFAIDSKTLTQRRELQRRQRDQAEENLAAEVSRFEHMIRRLTPLCIDAESTELITTLLSRLDIIVKAAQRISISTQVYGGVQQEYRLTAAVNLMLVHLRNMQQQRDAARRQLQCTKKMLQESTIAAENENTSNSIAVNRRMSCSVNGRMVTKRRASIATIPRPLDSPSASGPSGIATATKRAVRRISADVYSEHSARHLDSRHRPEWIPLERSIPALRSSRPSRLELGLDLSKIHEGSVESTANLNEESDEDITTFETPTGVFTNSIIEQQFAAQELDSFKDHLIEVLTAIIRFVRYCWNRWMRDGTTREIILIVAFFCFALLSSIILNAMIWDQLTRQGTIVRRIPWAWMTWDEFWSLFYEVRNTGPPPI